MVYRFVGSIDGFRDVDGAKSDFFFSNRPVRIKVSVRHPCVTFNVESQKKWAEGVACEQDA